MGLGRHQVRRTSGTASEHLLKEDAGLDRSQENQELKVGDIDTGCKKVNGNSHFGVGPVAELTDLLQWPIDSTCDLAGERLTPAKDILG
ncbi:Uncharacterised protein [Mycobacteroides abscessus]|nr:Uncharacterised protein [Mycobacteroides abscessus]SKT68428.1 Uncharacterised protein [Mycobacteroides abscessus subsp. massiliense]